MNASSTTPTTADEQPTDCPLLYEITIRFNRPLAHPRDDVVDVESAISRHYKKCTRDGWPAFDVDASAGVATVVLEASELETVGRLSKASNRLDRKLRTVYSRDDERKGPTLGRSSVYKNTASLAQRYHKTGEMPRRHRDKLVDEEQAEKARERVAEFEEEEKRAHQERVEAEYEPLAGEAPYDAPKLAIDDVHVRTLEGAAPAPIDGDRFGGDRDE